MKKQVIENEQEFKKFRTIIDILNFSPKSYQHSPKWIEYISSFEKNVSEIINQTNPDELNSNMLDYNIDIMASEEKKYVEEQHKNHINAIFHNIRILRGEVLRAEKLKSDLENDVQMIENEIKKYEDKIAMEVK